MKLRRIACVAAVSLLALVSTAFAAELDQGKQMMSAGDLQGAAEFFNRYAASHPDDSKATPEALALCGRTLDALADSLTGSAEKRCYWGKGGGGGPDCMQREASSFNAKFGEGAFRYEHAITYIVYTGSHYRRLLDRFPKSDYAAEADFYLVLHDLQGQPDVVLPKIKAFLSRHPKGEWNLRGLLLWARVNDDVWYVHKKWSWVLYNSQISQDELIIRAEPYRQEALRTYERLMKEKGTFEGRAAEREYALLNANKENGTVYSIVNDSSPGTLSSWGVAAPAPPVQPPDRGGRPAGTARTPNAAQPVAAVPEPTAPQQPAVKAPKEKIVPSSPKRWQ
ncbi:MAG: hypothetical protein V2A66_05245 [Pseudomonadota bacterium]